MAGLLNASCVRCEACAGPGLGVVRESSDASALSSPTDTLPSSEVVEWDGGGDWGEAIVADVSLTTVC